MSKFNTIKHNGVLFPEDYQVKSYELAGEKLAPLAEEMLFKYSSMKETDYFKNPLFHKNFYSCLKNELSSKQAKLSFPADFSDLVNKMFDDAQVIKQEKAEYRKANKEALKKEADERKEKYGFAEVDGKRLPISSPMIEAPSIFIARGASKLIGYWKYKTNPEDITINYIGDNNAPSAPAGHNWKAVEQNTNNFAIAYYDVNVGNVYKTHKAIIVGGEIKENSDEKKFDKAVNLLKNWDKMEAHIEKGLSSKIAKKSECALISWLVKTTGIRVGSYDTEGQVNENGVVGASTLRKKNIQIKDNKIHLNFIGKDSVVFDNAYEAPELVINCLNNKLKNKKAEDKVFTASANDVSNFLSECVPDTTAKLFRTAWASFLFVEAFKAQNVQKDWPLSKKLRSYDLANLEVAKKLNHQKNVGKNFAAQLEKMDDSISGQQDKIKELVEKTKADLEKVKQDIKKLNEKNPVNIKEKKAKLKEKEAKIKLRLEKAKERLESLKDKKDMKQKTANFALTTSRTNYTSPKLAWSICKDLDIPIEKIYTKSAIKTKMWAENTPKDYWRKYPNV